MMLRKLWPLLVIATLLAACASKSAAGSTPAVPFWTTIPSTGPLAGSPSGRPPSYKVAAFYYPWYGTPQFDSQWKHWTQNDHTPPQDIASDYYPALGPYSSDDPAVVSQHMQWLRQAGVGVIIVSWWGQGSSNERALPVIMQMAQRYGIKVAFHIEPYNGRTADGLVKDVQYLYQRFGDSSAFFRSDLGSTYSPGEMPKGMFFVWCVKYAGNCGGGDKVQADYWKQAVDEIHALPGGTLVIANSTDASWVSAGHFDGLYNYASLQLDRDGGFAWAAKLPAGSLFIPSVMPGFSAHRVGYPADKFLARDDGKTYDSQWTAALGAGVQPAMVTITSFNEWHEGSMIEPAAIGENDGHGYDYANFGDLPPDGYLNLTRQWVEKFIASP